MGNPNSILGVDTGRPIPQAIWTNLGNITNLGFIGSYSMQAFLILVIFGMGALSANAKVCRPLIEYDAIIETVTNRFVDQTFRGLDWPTRVKFHRERIHCEMNANDVSLVANQLLLELKTSHTALFTRSDQDYWALHSIFSGNLIDFPIAFSGIWASKQHGVWVARNVLLGSPAYRLGVRPGDYLLSLDGQDYSPLSWRKGRRSTLRFSSDGVNVRTVKITPEWGSVQKFFLRATKESERIFEVDGQRIGYVHLWCGTHEHFLRALNKSLRKFENLGVQSIIIDLRDGFGGANLDYLSELRTNKGLALVKKYFLINNGVRSGKEWITAVFKHDNLGTVVGTTTAGAFMGGAPFSFFNGKYLLYLAVAEFIPPDIGPIEGIGVAPDIEVLGCQELCQGKDPQLESAIDLARRRL